MKILAFDLSTRRGSIALMAEEKILVAHDWPNDRRNSAPFFETLQQIVSEYGRAELIVVGLGPGSYTGTRIAISAAMGLVASSGAQLGGIPSIRAISDENDFVVIGDAKRSSFFFARGHRQDANATPELLSEAETNERIAATNVPIYTSDELPQFPRAKLRFPSAELFCRLAKNPQNLVSAPLSPIYLREPHITAPRARIAK